MPQAPDPSSDLLRKAARLYRIPGVTQAEVCERLGISRATLKQAREQIDLSDLSRPRELVLASLTDTGRRTQGAWPDAGERSRLASYLDFVNKDGSTAETVEAVLNALIEDRVIAREGQTFVLRVPFP